MTIMSPLFTVAIVRVDSAAADPIPAITLANPASPVAIRCVLVERAIGVSPAAP